MYTTVLFGAVSLRSEVSYGTPIINWKPFVQDPYQHPFSFDLLDSAKWLILPTRASLVLFC